MAKLKRDTEQYSRGGLLLDRLCREKGWSFHRLARESGTSQTTIVRSARGQRIPKREAVEKWCVALGSDMTEVMHAFGYATTEEMKGGVHMETGGGEE